MPTPMVDLSPQVREAFDEGCRAAFQTSEQRAWAGRETRELVWRFAAHYQRLIALPRRTRRAIERRWKCTLSAIALLMTLGLAPASAAVLEVTPGTPPAINADGKCSLIEAIVNANRNARTHLDCVAGAGPDTIVLPAKSQQRLNGQELLPQITSRIVIEGHESIVLRNWNTSVSPSLTFFRVSASGDLTLNETTVSGVTATAGGYGVGVVNAGGVITLNNSGILDTRAGLQNTGTAVLENSYVHGNGSFNFDTGFAAGGITNDAGGTLTLRNCVVTGNRAYDGGGGIYNGSDSTATVIDSLVSQNASYEDDGGGIANRGTLRLVGSTVSGNGADSGGGIWNFGAGTATVRRSTISGNRAATYNRYAGAGIANGATLTLTNSTVTDNFAYFAGAGVTNSGELTIVSSTVTGNGAQYGAGLVVSYGGTVTLKRSIVSGNRAPGTGREITILDGAVTADDHNLFGHDGDAGVAGFTPGSTDIVPNEPLRGILLPLADNGGETRTHALAIGSPALDASPDDAGCPATDQRGNPRPQGPACDIGSFEGSAVLCNGRVTTMVGTDDADELNGTDGADVIAGLNGNDVIGGFIGNDLICAGGGADSVFGSSGNDVLFGQGGNDRLFGHSGNDTLNGGTGQDQCDGGSGAADTATACEAVSNVP
jgi:hypothetical protein